MTTVSCKKSIPRVDFSSASYAALGTYDNNGKPFYLLTPDTVSDNLMTFVNTILPERANAAKLHPELFDTAKKVSVEVTQSADLYLTFLADNTGYPNSLAFYVYSTNTPPANTRDIKLITYVFPSAGVKTQLKRGDKVRLGHFEPGTSVGFILLQSAWDSNTSKVNNLAMHFCTNDILNPENNLALRRHAVLINYKPENKDIIGFEDINRENPDCDNDFNDILFYCSNK